nr:MYXO-CTERM sorting domain-containing protein [Kofleriaceae bacterium]
MNQTIEGGGQVRVTPTGFNKMTSILPGVLNSAFKSGFTIPGGTAISIVSYCGGSGGAGCHIAVTLNSVTVNVTNQQTLHLAIDAAGSTSVPLSVPIIGSCTMDVSVAHLQADTDLDLGIDPTTGELTVHLADINNFSFNGQSFTGCGIVSDLADVVVDILNSAVGQFVIQLLTPVLDGLVQNLLPKPLGIAGIMDVGQLLQGVSPGTTAEMEARIVPGGYVALKDSGMSLGIITGINSDQDPSTRGSGLASEPALCVPPIPIADYGAAPYSLPLSSRDTFILNPAGALDGSDDSTINDLAIGISQTTLNLAGHHMVTSGALCLGVGTSLIPQLNVGTLGLLVPSLAELDPTGKAPLLLVTRPQRELTMTVGDNTGSASPGITIHVSHMEVDFYAFLYERYVRAFTLDLSMDVGVTLEPMMGSGSAVELQPILSGLSPQAITLSVINSEFVAESPQMLEAVLPSVFGLVMSQLNIPAFALPSFAGFTINDPQIVHLKTSQDDFLAVTAQLGASADFRKLALTDPFAADAVAHMDATIKPMTAPSTGTAKLVAVHAPSQQAVRAGLQQMPGGAMPTIEFATDARDSYGRELEWSWNLDGGLWRPWVATDRLIIQDNALAWQGHYTVGLRSRVKGDWRTVTVIGETPVTIDSVAPAFGKVEVVGDSFTLPVTDVTDNDNLEVAWGKPSATAPGVAWQRASAIAMTKAAAAPFLEDGELAVYVRDPSGNRTVNLVAPFAVPDFHGQGDGTGCASCNSGGAPSTGALALFGLVGLALFVPRRRRMAVLKFGGAWLVLATAMSLQPGCSCHTNQGAACNTGSDCDPTACGSGELPFCINGTCVCSPDIEPGRIGSYSAVATDPTTGNAFVSAYAETYGDLVVANVHDGRVPDTQWEWVDGVPAGPVVVPGSMIRGGIMDSGSDVGMYTSIAVSADGTPQVTYFDRDNGSLKYAAKVAGTWQVHVVDQGIGSIDGVGGSEVGMYTAITLRGDDGRPGVAYLAHVHDSAGEHAEVRFAASQVAHPASASDWQTWIVDTGDVPDGSNDPYPLPGGLGLFITASRDPNTQAPVVAYYDRANGELKMSTFDVTAGQFGVPVVLAGTADDAGWSPSIAMDMAGNAHVAYVDATSDDLDLVTSGSAGSNQIVDDGYRIVGTTVDGLPKPTYDFVGDDATLVMVGGTSPLIVYQDATTQELLLAHQSSNGTWLHDSIAGATQPWPGAYGFFASAALTTTELVMSTWVIDQPTNDNWVEVFREDTSVLQ